MPLGARRPNAKVRLPGSKSITNRCLLLAALGPGTSVLRGALRSDDSEVFVRALNQLGIAVEEREDELTVHGRGGGSDVRTADIDVRLSGTSARFLCPLLALSHGQYRMDGTERMRQRPMGELVTVLRALGADVTGGPTLPLVVTGHGRLRGGTVAVSTRETSQHLSGVLMIAPYAETDVELHQEGPANSWSYVAMTVALMEQFGVHVEQPEAGVLRIRAGQRYRPQVFAVEPDASAACYFWALAALSGGQVQTLGLRRDQSLQGDTRFLDVLEAMGATVWDDPDGVRVQGPPLGRLHAVDVDMNEISDQVPTFVVLSLFADGPCTVRNVAHIRGKESDRIAAPAQEVRRLGGRCEEHPDGLTIWPMPQTADPVCLETYGDHRMAMAFALVGLRRPGISIRDPGCVAKTFPNFFAVLDQAVGE